VAAARVPLKAGCAPGGVGYGLDRLSRGRLGLGRDTTPGCGLEPPGLERPLGAGHSLRIVSSLRMAATSATLGSEPVLGPAHGRTRGPEGRLLAGLPRARSRAMKALSGAVCRVAIRAAMNSAWRTSLRPPRIARWPEDRLRQQRCRQHEADARHGGEPRAHRGERRPGVPPPAGPRTGLASRPVALAKSRTRAGLTRATASPAALRAACTGRS
jgi:hypothetical protein